MKLRFDSDLELKKLKTIYRFVFAFVVCLVPIILFLHFIFLLIDLRNIRMPRYDITQELEKKFNETCPAVPSGEEKRNKRKETTHQTL